MKKEKKKLKPDSKLYIAAGVQIVLSAVWAFFASILFKGNNTVAGIGFSVLFCCGITCVFIGETIKKRTEKDPDYTPKKFYKVLPIHGNLLVIAVACFMFALIFNLIGQSVAMIIFMLLFSWLIIAAAVIFFIKLDKKSKAAMLKNPPLKMPHLQKVNASPERWINPCSSCGTDLNKSPFDSIVVIDGKKYCEPCAESIRQIQKMGEQKQCTVCGNKFQPLDMIIVDDDYYCEKCYKKKFNL